MRRWLAGLLFGVAGALRHGQSNAFLALNSSRLQDVIGAPHAASDECFATLGVKSTVNYSSLDVRFDLLPSTKVIFEVGANHGWDLQEFIRRFPLAKIYTYEPVPEMYTDLVKQFGWNPLVNISQVGVADADGMANFTVAGESTSSVNGSLKTYGFEEQVPVALRDVDALLEEVAAATGRVPDAMSVNCEGCEYAVFSRMINSGWLGKIPFIQMSWHIVDRVPNRFKTRCWIEWALRSNGYVPTYYSDFGWEGWVLHTHAR